MTETASAPRGYAALLHSPAVFLMTLAFINWLGFASWGALLNNFAKEAAGFSGADIGILQSVREIPGFLAFTAIILFWFMREQVLAYVSLLTLGIGIALTGFHPTLGGLLLTTTIMSLGFHYYETAQQSLQLQLLPKAQAPRLLGRIAGASATAQLIAFGTIALVWKVFQPGYTIVFLVAGSLVVVLSVLAFLAFPRFQGSVPQNKGFVLRQRYWLYYALTFMSGARRQIFMAFGGFLLVERFGYDVSATAMLLLATYGINTFMGPLLGNLVGKIGERATIQIENVSLIAVFVGYALASHGHFASWGVYVAGALFIVDGVFFTLTLAQRTYFQKIADPADIAPTSAVAFTINHIAAVALPVTFGLIWLRDPAVVFYIGSAVATVSLGLAFLVPRHPAPGAETVIAPGLPAAAE
ncbi:MFS transporter [Bosea sp. (in: a-proteobacteria)]|uniref:MFS transporter n=1 Tax=Bosea sp. (in: a-proteobacteria) TaxID=1871050 RepID=UPI002733E5A6|nr:MFS transporter [Bosea sp. (in: a-proteobacteria)]MDP3410295.1 MFS transporter [Bosea sp. (in: a-proteobacteria)]